MLINGVESDVISPLDRGLHYGDGLFETIAVKNGKLQLWDQHIQRLLQSAECLGLPLIDESLLYTEAKHLFSDKSSKNQAILKIILSRGSGGRGYCPPDHPAITRILLNYPWPSYPYSYWKDGVHVEICNTRLGVNLALAGMKHLNRLEQVLASREWCEPEVQEGLMLDQQGRVIEGTRTNLFLVKNNQLITPELSGSGVEGVMRGFIIQLAKKIGIKTHIREVMPELLETVDELFLCNSVIGIWPVKSVGKIVHSEHSLTRELMTLLEHQLVHGGTEL